MPRHAVTPRLADLSDAELRARRAAHGLPPEGTRLVLRQSTYAEWLQDCRAGIGVGPRTELAARVGYVDVPDSLQGYDHDHLVAACLGVGSTMAMEDDCGARRVHLDDLLRMAGVRVLPDDEFARLTRRGTTPDTIEPPVPERALALRALGPRLPTTPASGAIARSR